MWMQTGVIEGSRADDDWNLYEWEAASLQRQVNFERPFSKPPRVVVGLTSFAMEQNGYKFVSASVGGVTSEGFEIVFESGRNTQLEKVGAFWLAHGE